MPKKQNYYTKQQLESCFKGTNMGSWKFVKADIGLPTTVKEKGEAAVRALKVEKPIFKKLENGSNGQELDQNRMQLDEVEDLFGDAKWWLTVRKHVQEQLDLIYPNLQLCHISALKSLAGGEKQELHTDFGIFDFARFAGVISFIKACALLFLKPLFMLSSSPGVEESVIS